MAAGTDVLIIGGGMVGLATAYHLARKGATVRLLQAGDLGSGSSAACAGRAQVAEGKLDPLNLRIVREGFARFSTLEAELEMNFEFRHQDLLVLINSERHWAAWKQRAEALTNGGIPTELVQREALRRLEPHLHTNEYWGAARATEGWVNPFLYCWGYATAARRKGAVLHAHEPVLGMAVRGERVTAVTTPTARYQADNIAVMCGAWTAPVLQLAGVHLPVHFTHVQAFITTPTLLPVQHTIALADFYDRIHGKQQAIAVGFNQDSGGRLIVTEAVEQTKERHSGTNAWGHAGIAKALLQLYPDLAALPVLRSWGVPTPFTPDDDPIVGWVPGRENLFAAAGFMQTITAVPLLSDWIAETLLGVPPPVDLSLFSPARFHANWKTESHNY